MAPQHPSSSSRRSRARAAAKDDVEVEVVWFNATWNKFNLSILRGRLRPAIYCYITPKGAADGGNGKAPPLVVAFHAGASEGEARRTLVMGADVPYSPCIEISARAFLLHAKTLVDESAEMLPSSHVLRLPAWYVMNARETDTTKPMIVEDAWYALDASAFVSVVRAWLQPLAMMLHLRDDRQWCAQLYGMPHRLVFAVGYRLTGEELAAAQRRQGGGDFELKPGSGVTCAYMHAITVTHNLVRRPGGKSEVVASGVTSPSAVGPAIDYGGDVVHKYLERALQSALVLAAIVSDLTVSCGRKHFFAEAGIDVEQPSPCHTCGRLCKATTKCTGCMQASYCEDCGSTSRTHARQCIAGFINLTIDLGPFLGA